MAMNVRALQAAVVAAVLDSEYQKLLLTDRTAAIQMLPQQQCMPPVHLTLEDRAAFERLPTSSFQALAERVRQLGLDERRRSRRDEGDLSAVNAAALAFAG